MKYSDVLKLNRTSGVFSFPLVSFGAGADALDWKYRRGV